MTKPLPTQAEQRITAGQCMWDHHPATVIWTTEPARHRIPLCAACYTTWQANAQKEPALCPAAIEHLPAGEAMTTRRTLTTRQNAATFIASVSGYTLVTLIPGLPLSGPGGSGYWAGLITLTAFFVGMAVGRRWP